MKASCREEWIDDLDSIEDLAMLEVLPVESCAI